jgi:hypothetical protein
MTSYTTFKIFADGFNEALADFQTSVSKTLAYAEVHAALEDLKLHPSKTSGGVIQVFRPLGGEYEPDSEDIDEGLPGGLICQKVELTVAVDPDPDYEYRIKRNTFGQYTFPSTYLTEYGKGEPKNGKVVIEALAYSMSP